jgi:alpha-1,2-mannosyltransferase
MSPAAAAANETTTMTKKIPPRREKETKKRSNRKDELTSSRLFLLLVAFRASSSFHNLIHDCDETFQSWEPVHFLLCDEGVQSWELSGEFKLRSYLYLLLHAWVGLPFRFLFGCRSGRGKEIVFYAMRFALAIFSVRGDSFLVKECLMIEPKVGATVLLVLSFATGNFVSSTAMLPNSFAMGCVTRAAASAIEYLNFRATRERFGEFVAKEELKRKKKIKKAKVSDDEVEEDEDDDEDVVVEETLVIESRAMERACMWCVVGVLVGWPFAGVACVPIGLLSIWMVRAWRTAKAIVLPTVIILILSTMCDTFFYGGFSNGIFKTEWTSSLVNIVKYNVRGSGGSELYGTENWSFYLRNLALQFNVAFPLALVAPITALFSHLFQRIIEAKQKNANTTTASKRTKVPWLALLFCALPFHVALGFFSLMPHKEERFLYIVYGPLALSAGISVAAIFDTFRTFSCVTKRVKTGPFLKSSHRAFTLFAALLGVSSLMLFILLSASRTFALITYYGAPIEIYASLPVKPLGWLPDKNPNDIVNVCVGDEWYRFPSHFHLPNEKYRIRFIKGAFNGALPMYFESAAGKGTAGAPVGLNDKNQAHENQWFFPNASSPCDFLVETDETNDSQKYFKEEPNDYGWDVVRSLPFLDNSRSTDFLARTLYIPGYSGKHNVFTKYYLKVRTKNIATGEFLGIGDSSK